MSERFSRQMEEQLTTPLGTRVRTPVWSIVQVFLSYLHMVHNPFLAICVQVLGHCGVTKTKIGQIPQAAKP
jgi:hypothetical protein